MPRRSPARYLAPLALVAFIIALLVVVTPGGESTGGDVSSDVPAADSTAEPAPSPEGEEADQQEPSGPRFYDVQPGDTPSTIAERTGVPLERLESLNPDIDPQQLTPGQRIRLRR